jgi:hypothetical protein
MVQGGKNAFTHYRHGRPELSAPGKFLWVIENLFQRCPVFVLMNSGKRYM